MFLKAGEGLRKHGHAKGVNRNQKGAMCVAGAIRYALTGDAYAGHTENYPRQDDLATVIDTENIVEWNDASARTTADVVFALDAAAVVALQEEGVEPEDVL